MDDLLPSYERELALLRDGSKLFALKYPKVAGRLGLSSGITEDPHVERLIQSVALIAARTHKRLDDDFPLITESLLDVLYPHYLRPFPSCSIAHLDLGTSAGQLTAPARVARSTQLNARQAKGVTCKFRTAYDVDLLPIKVVSASYRHGAVAPEGTAKLPVTATAVLSIQLEVTSGQMPLAKLPERLRFFLDAEPSLVSTLREVLCHRTVAWMVQTTPHGPWSGPFKQRPEMVGFGEDEALIDFDERSHPAYRLLTEYFAFPEKFNFIDLPLPKAALSSFLGDQTSDDSEGMSRVFTLHVVLEGLRSDSDQARLLESVTARTFVLGCTPVVNLFQQNADPIRVTHAATEYPVVVDARRAFGYEVHSIDKVFRVKQTPHGESIDEFRPFFSLHHDDLLGQGDSVGEKPPGRYWHTHRDASVAETSPGYELSMSIVDADFEPAAPQTDTLSIQVTATNRDLPGLLSFGNVGGDLFMEGGSVAREIRLLRKPTPSHQFERGKGSLWRLVSHLSLNHLSLSGRGVDAIKEMLRLYDLPQDAANRRQVDGLIAIEFVPTTAWLAGEPFAAFVRGTEVRLTVDEESYVGTGLSLFAALLDRFFGLYVHINSFTQLTILSMRSGQILYQCPPRSGATALV